MLTPPHSLLHSRHCPPQTCTWPPLIPPSRINRSVTSSRKPSTATLPKMSLSLPITPHPTALFGFCLALTSIINLHLHRQIYFHPPLECELSRVEILSFHKAPTLSLTPSTTPVPRECLAVSQVQDLATFSHRLCSCCRGFHNRLHVAALPASSLLFSV